MFGVLVEGFEGVADVFADLGVFLDLRLDGGEDVMVDGRVHGHGGGRWKRFGVYVGVPRVRWRWWKWSEVKEVE